MELKDLAPWIAIAITLSLSILVPLFTQIANNKHQRKLQNDQFKREDSQKCVEAYENFLSEVGGLINAKGYVEKEQLIKSGAALHTLYIYAPAEWFDDLDKLSTLMMNFHWEEASPIIKKLDRLISEELKTSNQNHKNKRDKKHDQL